MGANVLILCYPAVIRVKDQNLRAHGALLQNLFQRIDEIIHIAFVKRSNIHPR